MAALGYSKRWGTQKPPAGAAVDRGHPLAQGLAGAWLLNGQGVPRDLVTGYIGTVSGFGNSNGQVGDSPLLGGSMASNGAASNAGKAILRPSGSPALSGKSAWTVWALVGGLSAVGTNGMPLYCERATSGSDILKLGLVGTTSASVLVAYRNDGGTLINSNLSAGTGNTFQGPGPHSAAMVFNGAGITGYRDGRSLSTVAWSSNNTLTNANIQTTAGADVADATNAWGAAKIAALYIWTRALTADELYLLESQPYAFIAPQSPRRRLWVSAPSTFTGTGASTLPSLTQSAAGTFTKPTYTGTGVSSLQPVTQQASGTFTKPVYTATAASVLPSLTQAAAGTATPPTFTGTATSAVPPLTQTAAGTFTAPVYTASGASVLAPLTEAASGTVTAPTYTGTAGSSLPAVTQQAVGVTTPPTFTGSAASVLPSVTQTAAGTVTGAVTPRGPFYATLTASRQATASITARQVTSALTARQATGALTASRQATPALTASRQTSGELSD